MCKQKLDIFIDEDLSGNSTEVRFGLSGITIGLLLFLLPLSLYFLEKGGVLMLPPVVSAIIGIILAIIWLLLFIFWIYVLWRWSKSRLQDTTHKELLNIYNILENINDKLGNEAKRNERKHKSDTKV